jgi:LPXTG-site transpeptidase (sortase) family protein
MSALLKRLGLIVRSTAVLVVLWNIQTVLTIARPSVIKLATASTLPIADTVAVPKKGDLSFHFPRLGINAPITESADSSPLKQQDWQQIKLALTKGVSLSYEGSDFETAPLAFVTGHSSDTYPHPYSGVFAGLGQAKIGDVFTVYRNEKGYQYTIEQISIVNPTDTQAFLHLRPTDATSQYVALVTCWPLFTTNQRLVVLGRAM